MGDFSNYPRVRSSVFSEKEQTALVNLAYRSTTGGSVCGWSPDSVNQGSREYSDYHVQTTGDTEVPNVHKRLNAGEIICNPFKTESVHETFPKFAEFFHSYGYTDKRLTCGDGSKLDMKYEFEGPFIPPALPDYLDGSGLDVDRQAVIDKAVTQSWANIDASSMLALATAAEGRKTVESMYQILRRVFRIAKAVKRLNLRALKREFSRKELADRYMELRYAIRPLVYDVVGIVDALSVERSPVRQTFRGYASDSKSITADVTSDPIWLVKADWVKSVNLTVSARAGVLCDVNVESYNVWGFDQPIESLWELVPFSFIIDWFANVGDTIAAWTPNAGVNARASWVTVREVRTFTNKVVGLRSTAEPYGYHTSSISYGGSPAWVREEKVLERIVNPPLAVAPNIKLRLDMFKLTDLGIILRNILR